MTKSNIILRDLPFWSRVNERAGFILLVSITSIDETLRERMEPGASSFADRLETLRAFKDAGCATGALAMPFLPGLSDSVESIQAIFSACKEAGVDFIMPGGLTLRPGRQKACYLETLRRFAPSLVEYTTSIYHEERPSGAPTRQARAELFMKIKKVQKAFEIPFLLPHRIYAKILPPYDALRILFQDMIELYAERRIDTTPLKRSSDRYDEWLIKLRRVFRRKRSLPPQWLEERFSQAIRSDEIVEILDNPKLATFTSSVLIEGARLNYSDLRLE